MDWLEIYWHISNGAMGIPSGNLTSRGKWPVCQMICLYISCTLNIAIFHGCVGLLQGNWGVFRGKRFKSLPNS